MDSLNEFATPDDIKVDNADRLGGFQPLPSGLYKMNIDQAFLNDSPGGATGLNLHLSDGKGNQLRETLWIRSGTAKGRQIYYEDKRTGEKRLLPGMQMANAIAQLTSDADFGSLDSEETVLSVYDSASGSEKPTKVQLITGLMKKSIILGVKHNIVDKNVKDGNGRYVPSGQTREENEIDAVFSSETQMSVGEKMGGNSEAKFIHDWNEKWAGTVNDRSTKTPAASSAPGGAVQSPGEAVKPTPALFPGQS